jgi:hypothetical protein
MAGGVVTVRSLARLCTARGFFTSSDIYKRVGFMNLDNYECHFRFSISNLFDQVFIFIIK